jgi:hypothetical protein
VSDIVVCISIFYQLLVKLGSEVASLFRSEVLYEIERDLDGYFEKKISTENFYSNG